MGKYLFALAALGVGTYLYMHLYMAPSKNMQAAAEYEIAQLHNPLIPIPANVREMQERLDADMQAGTKITLVSSPAPRSGLD